MVLLDSTVLIDYLRGRPAAEEGWLAGTWRREAATEGTTLTQADCLIAAAAVTAGERPATGNPKDFEHTPALVDHWPVGR
jgi:predicted nucleic acid-binding protein